MTVWKSVYEMQSQSYKLKLIKDTIMSQNYEIKKIQNMRNIFNNK